MARKICLDVGGSAMQPVAFRLNEPMTVDLRNSGDSAVAFKTKKTPNGDINVKNATGVIEPQKRISASIEFQGATESSDEDRLVFVTRPWKNSDSAATDGEEIDVGEDAEDVVRKFFSF